MLTFILFSVIFNIVSSQDNAADLEFSPYVFKHVDIPFKNNNYAKDWFGSDVALVQHPLLAPAKSIKPGNPVALPTIAPLVVKWSDLNNVKVNEQIGQNFEKRVDSHVWWPNK
uniref:Secreted protein n=1 Tax=Caenorhabditis tropicalis TaxID=1561998 RepID=A0A1I7UN11_9PELO